MTVWIYVDTSKQVGGVDHLKVFAGEDAANVGLPSTILKALAFKYPVVKRSPPEAMKPKPKEWTEVEKQALFRLARNGASIREIPRSLNGTRDR